MKLDKIAIDTTDDGGAQFETTVWIERGAFSGEQINLNAVRTVEMIECVDYRDLLDWLYDKCGFDRPIAIVFATMAMQLLGMGG